MDPILTGGQGQPQQPGASAQTARQGQSAAGARSVDATMSAVNNGLQGLTAALNAAATQAVAMTKQYNINASAQQKAVYSWTGSLKDMVQSAVQYNNVLDLTIDSTEDNTKATKQNTESRQKLTKEEKKAIKAATEKAEADKKAADAAVKASKDRLRQEDAAKQKEIQANQARARIEALSTSKFSDALRESREAAKQVAAVEEELAKNRQKQQKYQATGQGTRLAALERQRERLQSSLARHTEVQTAATEAMRRHTGGILSVSDVMSKLKGRLNDFSTGLAFGVAARKLYDEAQFAKTTGNYSTMGEFAGGQKDALMLGVGSQAYNEIMANARAAQITTSSLEEFNQNLMKGTDTFQTITGSREEGAKLAGEMYKQGATIGITMSQMGSQVDVLGETFGHLSKLTGKTSAEMAQLSVAIMNDATHREVLIGLQGQERANYMVKQMQDLKQLKLQGYSIEQAEELQKKAIQARERGLAESVTGDAKARMQANVISQIVGGQKGAQISQAQAQIDALVQKERTTNMTGDEVKENRELIQKLNNTITQQVAEAKAGSMSGVNRGLLNDWEKKRQEQTNARATDVATETGSTQAQKEAKMLEGNIGEKGSALDKATSAVGYVEALGKNTLALNLLTGAMMGGRLFDLGKTAWQNRGAIKGKFGNIAGRASSVIESVRGAPSLVTTVGNRAHDAIEASHAIGGGSKAAAGASYVTDAMKASKFIKGASLLAPLMGAIEGYSNYDAKKKNAGESVGLGLGSAAGGLAGGWGGAAAGAALGTMILPGVGTIVGGALGGLAGGWGGSELGGSLGKKAGATFDKTPEQKAVEAAKETIHPEQAKTAKEKETLEDLQKQYYKAALDFFKDSDPKTDAATRAKQADAMRRLAANANLASASFAAAPATGG